MKKQPLLKSFRFALDGIGHAWQRERNFRIHCGIAVIVLVISAWLQLDPLEWCIILLCIGSVLGMELINTAIEAIVDLVSPNYTEQARIAKDTAAAAVFCITIVSVIVGCIILIPALIETWSN